jgi:hypothetical protein
MESPRVNAELQVSESGLRMQAGWCESVAGRVAGNSAPSGTGSAVLASSAAVNAAHMQIAAAGVRCTSRVQATATKLAVGSAGYGENEGDSVAQLGTLDPATVS